MKKLILAICILIFTCVLGCAQWQSTRTTVDFKVTNLLIDTNGEYRLLTDHGEFSIGDSLALMRWDSSTVAAKFEDGKRYRAEVIGWRVPLLSMYPNVVEVKEALK